MRISLRYCYPCFFFVAVSRDVLGVRVIATVPELLRLSRGCCGCSCAAAAEVITHYSIFLLNALIAFGLPIKNKQVTRYPTQVQWQRLLPLERSWGRGSGVGGRRMLVSGHSQLCVHWPRWPKTMLSAVNAKDERTFGTQVPRHTPCTPCSLASALSPLSSAPWPCPRWRHAKSLPAHSTLYMGVLTHFPLSQALSLSLSCHTLSPLLWLLHIFCVAQLLRSLWEINAAIVCAIAAEWCRTVGQMHKGQSVQS